MLWAMVLRCTMAFSRTKSLATSPLGPRADEHGRLSCLWPRSCSTWYLDGCIAAIVNISKPFIRTSTTARPYISYKTLEAHPIIGLT